MQPHKIAASRVLLFDRLVDEDPKQLKEAQPFRVYTREQLMTSVAQELARLLNTRNPQTRSTGAVERTVLDYGLRDFSSLFAASPTDRETLAREIEDTIEAFEPRLQEVSITWEPTSEGRQQQLSANIQAKVKLGNLLEPVSFPLLIYSSTGEARVLLPNEVQSES